MGTPFYYKIRENNCWLSPERMLFWEEEKLLVASDLHFGKTGHFRKAGIPVPQSVYKEDLQRLVSQLQYFQPRRLLVVGDFFHSRDNLELDLFKKWRKDFSALEVDLVRGNHDRLEADWYRDAGIALHEAQLSVGAFSFRHDPAETSLDPGAYLFSGHLHPGVRISGIAKQSLSFPCFYFSPNQCILPAFSRFTGLAMLERRRGDQVFAIVNDSIIAC